MPGSSALPPSPPGIPIVGNTLAFATDPFGFVRQSVESTGDIFRMQLLGRDVYVVGDPDHVETALLNRDGFAKLDDFDVAFGDALLSVEDEQWRRQRHAMEGFFDPTRIAEFAETMLDVAETHVDDWSSGQEIRIDESMRSIALSNLFEIVLGHSLSASERTELAGDAHALNKWFKPTSWVFPYWVPTPARREFRRGSDRLREWARSLLEDAHDGPDQTSLLATLATLQDDRDSEFDRSEVLDQVVGMIFAGHETTALAMTYALHQIATHQTVADRLHAELDDVIDGKPSATDLQELEYVEQVINEALRLYPPVHAIPRETTEHVYLDEYEIPPDEQVLLSVWSIHRDSRFYDDPLTFDPDRWEETSSRERGYQFIPFGAGPRICIGRHFARLEMKATLATIGRCFRLDAEGDLDVSPQMTTQPAAPVNVSIRKRN